MSNTPQRVRPLRREVRAQVLAAAKDVFFDVGFHRASLAQIAERAGFTKGALYSNFDSKDDLFLALLEQEVTSRVEMLQQLVTGRLLQLGTVSEGLLAITEDSSTLLVFAEFRAYAANEPAIAQRLAEVRAHLLAWMAERIEEEVAALGLELRVPAAEAAALMAALVSGLALEQVGADRRVVSAASLDRVLMALLAQPSSQPRAGPVSPTDATEEPSCPPTAAGRRDASAGSTTSRESTRSSLAPPAASDGRSPSSSARPAQGST
ncbi:TetR/AcrR family transcriptional regulator [Nocardioides sp. REDSEA-S30_B4]|jgi:AcrR family transcriptional regulator|uniref:TetR/AcrR family transcriptional regulator n=1 Tax=Nocardioides sp. REDSEA-S30_B4 TaxID=1811552 RepID=UPI000AB5B561|nr:TetR/AcrR family transcriptional regulator [Nocardioides sp. REDSEA-S30_B4]